MKDNIESIQIIDIEKYIAMGINEIIKDATYSELSKYIEMLPRYYTGEDNLFDYGFDYLNEYYKIIGKIDKMNNVEMEDLKYKIYILYLEENYNNIKFTFDEFITFSRLLNVTFSEYNFNKIRERDKNPFQSNDKEIDSIVNSVAKAVIHSPHPHAYEITSFQLKILLNCLNTKKEALLEEEFDKIDLDETLLNSVLSNERIKELKNKRTKSKQIKK